jgi:CRP/FNR family transcriptional regulator, anaerobic regulatory protein
MGGQKLSLVPEALRCEQCSIRHQAVCGAMSDAEIETLNSIAHRRRFHAGQVIVSDQEPADFFANVLSGTIKLTKTLPDGRQQIVGLLFPPDFLGRAYSRSNPYFAEAATDVELCCFSHQSFERVIRDHPDLQHRLFERTLDELDAARDWMLLLGRKTAEEKLASFLVLLARRSLLTRCAKTGTGAAGGAVFDLPLTRADIADFLGLTIETVSRQLTKLKAQGLIRLKGSRTIEVPDAGQLQRIAGQDSLIA